jgi:hypothetical protein
LNSNFKNPIPKRTTGSPSIISRERMLGHDGFTLAFFQVCWDVIKADIMGVFHDFHARSKFEKKP